MTRHNVLLTGLSGLVGAVFLTGLCLYITTAGWIPPLLTNRTYVLLLFAFLGFFSLAEIPLMIFSMRRMVSSSNPRAKYVALVTNAGYTLFAGVYAVPFILMTGQSTLDLVLGSVLGGLSFIRFISSMVFLPYAKST